MCCRGSRNFLFVISEFKSRSARIRHQYNTKKTKAPLHFVTYTCQKVLFVSDCSRFARFFAAFSESFRIEL